MTDIQVLKQLGLSIGQEITLMELDMLVEKYINNSDIETPLESYSYEEILQWGKYVFYIEEGDEYNIKFYFKVIQNTGDENSIIKILEFKNR